MASKVKTPNRKFDIARDFLNALQKHNISDVAERKDIQSVLCWITNMLDRRNANSLVRDVKADFDRMAKEFDTKGKIIEEDILEKHRFEC